MAVLLLSLLAAFIWASTNHIDKYLISKIMKNGDYKGLLIFSSFVSGMLLLPVFLILSNFNIMMDLLSVLYMFLTVMCSVIAIIFYYKALDKNDAAIIVAIYQTIPVFVYILGLIFLKETLTVSQITGGIMILLSAVFITFSFEKLSFSKEKRIALFLMLGSSILYATEYLLFRLVTIKVDFNIACFWYYLMLMLAGLTLLVFKSYRKSFFSLVKTNGKKVFGLNIFNEVWYQLGGLLANYAMTLSPLAIISIISSGTQSIFVFIIGIVGTKFFPKTFDDETTKDLPQKLVCIILGVVGLLIFYLV